MTRRIEPLARPPHGVVAVPGSKSVANRALICAALADGRSTLRSVPSGDDTAAMLDALGTLGFGIGTETDTVSIDGGRQRMRPGPLTVEARLAGTTSRFVSALAALGPGPYTIDGEPPLRARPMGPLHEALTSLGVSVTAARAGHLPVEIAGPGEWRVTGGARYPTVRIAGDVSSQYISALMMIGPLLPGGLEIELTTPLVSRPYVGITAAVMEVFGVADVEIGERRVTVGPGAYRPADWTIEADASSASYPLAAAAICAGEVTVTGLTDTSVQGDAAFVELLGRMGCAVRRDRHGSRVRGTGRLRGIDVDMADISDLVPTVAAVALFADGPTTIRGVGFIRGKESDRLGDLAAELTKFGARVEVRPDGLHIAPTALHGARVATHHDHRLAMALGLVGLRVAGVEVEDPQVVGKSWPEYWAMLDGLR